MIDSDCLRVLILFSVRSLTLTHRFPHYPLKLTVWQRLNLDVYAPPFETSKRSLRLAVLFFSHRMHWKCPDTLAEL